jgi:hypothetical protein
MPTHDQCGPTVNSGGVTGLGEPVPRAPSCLSRNRDVTSVTLCKHTGSLGEAGPVPLGIFRQSVARSALAQEPSARQCSLFRCIMKYCHYKVIA